MDVFVIAFSAEDKGVFILDNLQTNSGDVPFFDVPYLDMRGFALGRYRDQYTPKYKSLLL